jgi:hypothetical protein
MKIQILNDISDCIDGYNPVFLNDGDLNIDAPNNSISNILMIDVIEQIPYENIDKIIKKIRTLLRINGSVTITGIEVNCMCRDLINKNINCATFNGILHNRKSIYDCSELADKLNDVGIQVERVTLKGSTYELHAIRQN